MIETLYVIYKDGEFFQTAKDYWEAQRNIDDNCAYPYTPDQRKRYTVFAYGYPTEVDMSSGCGAV